MRPNGLICLKLSNLKNVWVQMVRLCLLLQNLASVIKMQRAYQSLHGMQDPIEAKYATRWDDPLPQHRQSPALRKLNIKVVAAEYEAGQPLRELAAKFGVDRNTVALRLRKAGVILRLPACNVYIGPLGK